MGLFGKSKQQKAQDLMATGLKGIGTVVSVQDTGMTVNDSPRIKLTMRVEPLDGGPAFDAGKTKTVSRVEIPRQGDRYPVWYDAADPTTWAWATIADDNGRAMMREMFGKAAESFVGMGVPQAPAGGGGDIAAQLTQLAELRDKGVLTSEEFETQKSRLLAG